MNNPHLTVIEAKLNEAREDLRLAREHFATFTPGRMSVPWGSSGRTPEDVIKGYEGRVAELERASEEA